MPENSAEQTKSVSIVDLLAKRSLWIAYALLGAAMLPYYGWIGALAAWAILYYLWPLYRAAWSQWHAQRLLLVSRLFIIVILIGQISIWLFGFGLLLILLFQIFVAWQLVTGAYVLARNAPKD